MNMLNKIRKSHPQKSTPKKLAFTFLALLAGFGLAILTELFSGMSARVLPQWLESVNIRNLFATLMPWALGTLIISLFSRTPIRAAINVFTFSCGLILGCCVYLGVFVHILPDWSHLSYIVILTAISPLIAAVCWYGRGVGTVAGFVAAFILAYWFLQAFHFTPTFQGFGVNFTYGVLPLVFLAAAIGMKNRPFGRFFSWQLSFTLSAGTAARTILSPRKSGGIRALFPRRPRRPCP